MEYSIGMLSPPLHEQLGWDEEALRTEERAIENLNYLRIHGFLPSRAFDAAVLKVLKQVEKKAIKAGVLEKG